MSKIAPSLEDMFNQDYVVPVDDASDDTDVTPPTSDPDIIALPDDTPPETESTPTSTSEPDSAVKAYFETLNDFGVLKLPEDFEFDGTDERLEQALSVTKKAYYEEAAANI